MRQVTINVPKRVREGSVRCLAAGRRFLAGVRLNQRPRPHHPADAVGTGGSGDRIVDRRRFVLTSLAGALAAPLAAAAAPSPKVPRAAYLSPG